MKIASLLLSSLIFAAAAFAQEAVVGEYQLFSGIVEVVGKGTVVQQHVVFRIDTKTGTTWTYALAQGKDGKITEFWSQIPEFRERATPKSP